jgi:hypothetical protein
VTERRECTFPLSYSLLSFVIVLSLSLDARGFLDHPVVPRLRFIPWKLEIRILRENWKERVFLQHIDSLTLIHTCDEKWIREEGAHFLSLYLMSPLVLLFSLSLEVVQFLGVSWI